MVKHFSSLDDNELPGDGMHFSKQWLFIFYKQNMIRAAVGIDEGGRRTTREGKHYGYQLACVVDGGLFLDLSHEGSLGIGGAEGGLQGVHDRGGAEEGRRISVEL